MEFSKPINVDQYDTNQEIGGSSDPLPNGWYRVELIEQSDVKESKSQKSTGATYTLQVTRGDFKGRKVLLWFASEVFDSATSWMIAQTECFFARIAKVLGVAKLKRTQQLFDNPFYIFLTQQKTKRKVDDGENEQGEIIWKEIEQINVRFVGNADERILSVKEWSEKFGEKGETKSGKKFVKKSVNSRIPELTDSDDELFDDDDDENKDDNTPF